MLPEALDFDVLKTIIHFISKFILLVNLPIEVILNFIMLFNYKYQILVVIVAIIIN